MSVIDPKIRERGARRLFKVYEDTDDENVEYTFRDNAPASDREIAEQMRAWFEEAFKAALGIETKG